MPDPTPAEAALVRIGHALAHPLRVRALGLLQDGAPWRAGALAKRCHVALPRMKLHLRCLADAGLITILHVDDITWYRLDVAACRALRPLLSLGHGAPVENEGLDLPAGLGSAR